MYKITITVYIDVFNGWLPDILVWQQQFRTPTFLFSNTISKLPELSIQNNSKISLQFRHHYISEKCDISNFIFLIICYLNSWHLYYFRDLYRCNWVVIFISNNILCSRYMLFGLDRSRNCKFYEKNFHTVQYSWTMQLRNNKVKDTGKEIKCIKLDRSNWTFFYRHSLFMSFFHFQLNWDSYT